MFLVLVKFPIKTPLNDQKQSFLNEIIKTKRHLLINKFIKFKQITSF